MIVWLLDLQLPMQSVPITTNIVSSKPAHGEVYSIQHYVIKFASDLRQVCSFLRVMRFPPPIKLTRDKKITEILLKEALNTIILILKRNDFISCYFPISSVVTLTFLMNT